jgi:hypothetical protein
LEFGTKHNVDISNALLTELRRIASTCFKNYKRIPKVSVKQSFFILELLLPEFAAFSQRQDDESVMFQLYEHFVSCSERLESHKRALEVLQTNIAEEIAESKKAESTLRKLIGNFRKN